MAVADRADWFIPGIDDQRSESNPELQSQDSLEDAQLQAALQASMATMPSSGSSSSAPIDVSAVQEDEELQRALALSLEQQ